MPYDYLIVGAGFTGATCARVLADAGKRVLIIDKRDHIGGNAYDYVSEYGVRIHKYGPHIFHTNSDKVFAFLSCFTDWRPYEHRVLSAVNGQLVPFPINLTTLEMIFGRSFNELEAIAFLAERAKADYHGGPVVTAEDQVVSKVGRELFELFFEGYTRKMWGREARELDKSVTARIPIRFDRDDRYFTDKHQAMPKDGYTALFERMLEHPGIEVQLGEEHGCCAHPDYPARVIWTGPIDEYFGRSLGPLPYRSIDFYHTPETEWESKDADMATVNYPDPIVPHTRITNMAKLNDQAGACFTYEYPRARECLHTTGNPAPPATDFTMEPFYPIPAPENRALYKRYEALAAEEPNVTFLGRLGTYQYLNMDQAVGQALAACERMLGKAPATIGHV